MSTLVYEPRELISALPTNVIPTLPKEDKTISQILGYEPEKITPEAKIERLKVIGSHTRHLINKNVINAYLMGKNFYEASILHRDKEGREVGYLEWLRENAGMGITNSYSYRNFFENYCFFFESYLSSPRRLEELEKITHNINVSSFLGLSTPNVPDLARRESIAMLEAGEVISQEEAKILVRKYKLVTTNNTRQNSEHQSSSSIPNAWSESCNFNVTVSNNSEVSVRFESQFFYGTTKCYYFEFRGDIADCGIRSHHAPDNDAHSYASPKQYAQDVCETLHQKLQARRSNTPYHEFKKGDIVEVIKGRAKGIRTEIVQLMIGKSQCIVTTNGEFSPAQLRKILQDETKEISAD